MEEMLNGFKAEYVCQYSLYLDSADAVDSLLKQKDCDKQELVERLAPIFSVILTIKIIILVYMNTKLFWKIWYQKFSEKYLQKALTEYNLSAIIISVRNTYRRTK